MTPIQGADSADGQAFGRDDDRGVDSAEWKVSVSGDELGDAQPVRRGHGLREEVPGRKVAEKPNFWLDAQPGAE